MCKYIRRKKKEAYLHSFWHLPRRRHISSHSQAFKFSDSHRSQFSNVKTKPVDKLAAACVGRSRESAASQGHLYFAAQSYLPTYVPVRVRSGPPKRCSLATLGSLVRARLLSPPFEICICTFVFWTSTDSGLSTAK